jgi:hypothetical protein
VRGRTRAAILQRRASFRYDPLSYAVNRLEGTSHVWPGGAARKGDYKLIEFYEDGRLELFNLKHDIGERRNLARKEPKKAAELHGLLKRWRESVNATMPQVNPTYDAAKADQGLTGVEPRTPEQGDRSFPDSPASR